MFRGEWKDDYNIGCDYVDNAHRKLFAIVHKMQDLCSERDYEKNKFACRETLKYLKSYTETHFAQEEGFMRKTGYAGYEKHKQLHEELKNETLCQYAEKLERADYAQEVVAELIGVFAGWLSSHILIEDQAITGKAVSRYSAGTQGDELERLEKEVIRIVGDITGDPVSVADAAYHRPDISDGVYYEMEYNRSRAVFAANPSTIFRMVGTVLNATVDKMDREVLVAYLQMVHNIVKPMLVLFAPSELDVKSKKQMINRDEFGRYFEEYRVVCSVKWKVGDGEFAMALFDGEHSIR